MEDAIVIKLILDDMGLCLLRRLDEAMDAFDIAKDHHPGDEGWLERSRREHEYTIVVGEVNEHLSFLMWVYDNDYGALLQGGRHIDLGPDVVRLIYRFHDEVTLHQAGKEAPILDTIEEIMRAAVDVYRKHKEFER